VDEDGELPRNLPPLDPLNPLAGEMNVVDVAEFSDGLGGAQALDALGPVEMAPQLTGPAVVFFAFSIDGDFCADPAAPGFGLAWSGLFDEPWTADDLAPEFAPLEGFGRVLTVECFGDSARIAGHRNSEFGPWRPFDTDALGWIGDGIGVIGMGYEELRGPQGALFTGNGAGVPVDVMPAYGPDTPIRIRVPSVYDILEAETEEDLIDLLVEWFFGPSGDEEEVCIPPGFGRRLEFNVMDEYTRGFDLWSGIQMEGEPDTDQIELGGRGPGYEFDLRLKLDGSVDFERRNDDGTECSQEGTTEGVESIIPELSGGILGTTAPEPDPGVQPPADGDDGGFPWPFLVVVAMTLALIAWLWSQRRHQKPKEPERAIRVQSPAEDPVIEEPPPEE
jgi:hypothetical protein